MKKQLILVLILFSLSSVFAQNCKPYKKKKNRKTGEVSYKYGGKLSETRWNRNANTIFKFTPTIYLKNDQDGTYVVIHINGTRMFKFDDSQQRKWFSKPSSFELQLEDEKLVFDIEESQIKNYPGDSDIFIASYLTLNDIDALSNKKIVSYKIRPFGDTDYAVFEANVSNKYGKKLLNQFKCFKERESKKGFKIKNNKKAGSYSKIALNKLKHNDFKKALIFFKKSLKESPNEVISAYANITKLMINQNDKKAYQNFKSNLDNIKRSKDKKKSFEELENLLMKLMESNPDNSMIEESLNTLLEYY